MNGIKVREHLLFYICYDALIPVNVYNIHTQ